MPPVRVSFSDYLNIAYPNFGDVTFALVWVGRHFGHTNCFFTYLFIQQFLTLPENFNPVISDQVTKSDQVTLPKKNIYDFAVTIVFDVSIYNSQELIKASVPAKRLSQNFDVGYLRSGQF